MPLRYTNYEKFNKCIRTWTKPATRCTFIPGNRDRFIFTHLQFRPPLSFRPPHPFIRRLSVPHRNVLPPVKISLAFEMFTFSEEERWAMLLTTFAGLSTSLGAVIAVRFLYYLLHRRYYMLHYNSLQFHYLSLTNQEI